MKNNNLLLIGAVAIGAYLIYKKMGKTTDNGKELAPPPVSKPPVGKPSVSPKPSVTSSNNNLPIYY